MRTTKKKKKKYKIILWCSKKKNLKFKILENFKTSEEYCLSAFCLHKRVASKKHLYFWKYFPIILLQSAFLNSISFYETEENEQVLLIKKKTKSKALYSVH